MCNKNFSILQPGEACYGFKLIKCETVDSLKGKLYTMRHEKTKMDLLYFDRADENKTFAVAFKTLPEDNTGVFHILEHSVLNGSRKYPVKEPFVSLLQSSMQTFLNAMTYSDKTLFPVSSRNEQDLFNLMSVYLDGVFEPLIYEKPEIFMQEGWHYEFAEPTGHGTEEELMPYYNGVVYSEMKGAFADVDQLIADESQRMLFPDNSYGYTSGGRPEEITDLTYEKFIETHRRFYHPSNAIMFLDGHMDVERFLEYIDEEYLSKYEYRKCETEFKKQVPKQAQKTIEYQIQDGDGLQAHMCISGILCDFDEVEKLYAADILADFLTGSNMAPLKREILSRGLAQDVNMLVNEEMYQNTFSLVFYNTTAETFEEIKSVVPEVIRSMIENGIDGDALRASLERSAFASREISEPYGVELVSKALESMLYGGNPLGHIDNSGIFESLRNKLDTDYFEKLLYEMLGETDDKAYLYVLPSQTKADECKSCEQKKISCETASWDSQKLDEEYHRFVKMCEWQRSEDSEDIINTLPHLEISDIPEKIKSVDKSIAQVEGIDVLKVDVDTNGIVYINLYFDISDFTDEELCLTSVAASCLGELSTEYTPCDELMTRIKSDTGCISARVEVLSRTGELNESTPYLTVAFSALSENTDIAFELITELLTKGRYDETDKIYEMILQSEFILKQEIISEGQQFAITKALSAFSEENALKELLGGESFVKWFSALAENFEDKADMYVTEFTRLMNRAFARNRLFVGYSGDVGYESISNFVLSLPVSEIGVNAGHAGYDRGESGIDIPVDMGFTALGHNLYALGSHFDGCYAVLSSLMSYGYLWNLIRVSGGAYGTGMGVQMNGNIYAYSYRDPDVKGTREVYLSMSEFLLQAAEQDMPLDDIIIGTLGMIDPLLSPSSVCDMECSRYIKGITDSDIERIRAEILNTTCDDLKNMVDVIRKFETEGKFCAVCDEKTLDKLF